MTDPSPSTEVDRATLATAVITMAAAVWVILRRVSLGPWSIGLIVLGVLATGAALGIAVRGSAGRGEP